jgi:predicted PurR-regulated permease PerM
MSFPHPTRRQGHLFWTALSGLAIAILVGLIVLLVWGLGRVLDILSPVLWPLAVAGVVAYLLDPVIDYFERKGMRRPRAIVCVFSLAFVIVAGVAASVIPPIVTQTQDFRARIPAIQDKVVHFFQDWLKDPHAMSEKIFNPQPKDHAAPPVPVTSNAPEIIDTNSPAPPISSGSPSLNGFIDEKTLQSATGWIGKILPKAFSLLGMWFGILTGLALIPIYAFYLLLEKRGIQSKWTNYLPMHDSHFKDELVFILQSINDYMIAFFRGQVLVAICDGILYGLGFLFIAHLPYAVLLGAAAMVLTIVPFIGAVIIFVLAMLIALVQFGDWQHPLLVLAVFAVVQTLEGVVISPRIMKGRVGLHPLTIIIAVMVGTTLLGGVLGGILAIPLTAVLRVLMSRYVWKRAPQTGSS